MAAFFCDIFFGDENEKAPKVFIFGAFQCNLMIFDLSGKWDSDPRPSAWEADALPTELLPQFSGKNNKNFYSGNKK